MSANRDEARQRIHEAATRVAADYGLDVFDVQVRREAAGWMVRVVIDRPPPEDGSEEPADTEPVGIEDCQHVSRDLSAILDVEDDLTAGLDQGYTLEVSSPGLD